MFIKHGVWLGITFSMVAIILNLVGWFTCVIEEGITGHHTPSVIQGFKFGIILFIVREVFFFFGFF